MECLMLREEREGIDLVRDNVEHQLHKEVEVIEGIKALLQQKITEAFEQLCLLEEARHQLYCDVTDKLDALEIDGECVKLNNESQDINFQMNPTRTVKGSVTPETWNAFSQYNKHRGEAEMKASQHLREAIFATLEKARNDLNAQHRATHYEYRKRIHETDQAKNELGWQQKNTQDEIATMKQDIAGLCNSIEAKMAPMKVAQTRLEKRTHRKNVELCRDIPQYQLCHEVAEIDGSVKSLNEKLHVAETSLQSLLQDLTRLTDDLAIKTKSLALDQQCMKVRERLNSGAILESDQTAMDNTDPTLSSKMNDIQLDENSNQKEGSSIRDTNVNFQKIHDQTQIIDQNNDAMLSTYNFNFDDAKSKRLGDLQRTIGTKPVKHSAKVVDFA